MLVQQNELLFCWVRSVQVIKLSAMGGGAIDSVMRCGGTTTPPVVLIY